MTKHTPANARLMAAAPELLAILVRVLDWPLPEGSVRTYSLPQWLADEAQAAIDKATQEK
jgi:hypothetical protein